MQNVEETMGPDDDTHIYNVDNMPKKSTHKHILGDLLHFMDRFKLPMHHKYKALFFRSLRTAVFVMMKSDADYVNEVLNSKEGESWGKKWRSIWAILPEESDA